MKKVYNSKNIKRVLWYYNTCNTKKYIGGGK